MAQIFSASSAAGLLTAAWINDASINVPRLMIRLRA